MADGVEFAINEMSKEDITRIYNVLIAFALEK
jgi:hypothetical protein